MKKAINLCRVIMAALAAMALSAASVFAAPLGDNIDWGTQTVTVQGMGAPPVNARNATHAYMMARRAAQVDGYRQLAEAIKGVNVDAESTVENFMVTSDIVRTKVDAMIKGAQVIDEQRLPDGSCILTMSVPMFGVGGSGSIASSVLPRETVKETFPEPVQSVAPSQPAYDETASISVRIDVASKPAPPAKSSKAIGGYTGLIVDCRGLGLNPVMSPVVKNANGDKIYGHKNIDPDYVIAHGMVDYATSDAQVSRAGSNPLVVKAVSLDNHNGNPVISVADANRVLIENQTTGFLEKTKVVFIR